MDGATRKVILLLLLFPAFFRSAAAIPDSCWVDSVFHSLSLEERIGQLIIARANKDNVYLSGVTELVKSNKIGGVIFFKSSPHRQAAITNYWQSLSKVPLFVSIDAERGLGMRLDSAAGFPYMMTLGAVRDDSLVYRIGERIAEQCSRTGINIDFAPVVDINSNPKNPVINIRSFGEDRDNVARKAETFLNGLASHGILGTAKHFPGHGDTDTDSHHTLPVVNHSRAMLDSVDLYPYRKLISKGLEGIMIAHLDVPALDSTPGVPSTLSRPIITDLLREKMGFSGLVFTDALEMKGVTKSNEPGDIEVKALMAGNDILLMPTDVTLAVKKIRQAVDSCIIWPEDIDEKCWKILEFKHKMRLHEHRPVILEGLTADLNTTEDAILTRSVMDHAITLVKNRGNLLPLRDMHSMKIACVSLGDSIQNGFHRAMERYAVAGHYFLPKNADCRFLDSLERLLLPYDLVIMGIVNTSVLAEKRFGIPDATIDFINCYRGNKHMALMVFGNPYCLSLFGSMDQFDAVTVTYQENSDAYDIAAQQFFGARTFKGNLPVTAMPGFPSGTGICTEAAGRLSYVNIVEAGLNPKLVKQIDSIVDEGLKAGAYPGCQVAFAWKGKVIFNKAYGWQDGSMKRAVKTDDIYDLASLTKISATAIAIMKLYDEGRLDPDASLGKYLPMTRGTNKEHIKIDELMAHQAGLVPWIPFYRDFLKDGYPDTNHFRLVWDTAFSIRVADSLFMRNDLKDTIMRRILDSPLTGRGTYKYSDIGFYLLRELIEQITGQAFQDYLQEHFYKPLGMAVTGFNPLATFPLFRIIPTACDTVFRRQCLRGYVHDPGAALLGGVSGHAGLFSNANDLLILMQMLLNEGEYAGQRYLEAATIKEFTSCRFHRGHNRRAMGFDRQLETPAADGPACLSASQASFGHSGFTGTYMWADPECELSYVFLSNRVHPDEDNKLLSNLNIRTRIHEVMYQALRGK